MVKRDGEERFQQPLKLVQLLSIFQNELESLINMFLNTSSITSQWYHLWVVYAPIFHSCRHMSISQGGIIKLINFATMETSI